MVDKIYISTTANSDCCPLSISNAITAQTLSHSGGDVLKVAAEPLDQCGPHLGFQEVLILEITFLWAEDLPQKIIVRWCQVSTKPAVNWCHFCREVCMEYLVNLQLVDQAQLWKSMNPNLESVNITEEE